MGISEKLTDDELKNVSGGAVAKNPAFDAKREEFDEAWEMLGMEQKDFSGMKRAQMFDDWVSVSSTTTAVSYLSKAKN